MFELFVGLVNATPLKDVWFGYVCFLPFPAEAEATKAINIAMGFMYSSGFWIASADASRLASFINCFLAKYVKLAEATLRMRKRRFPVIPKIHMMAHAGQDLLQQAAAASWAINPAAFTNQMQEDFIGRPSRTSRRVHPRSLATSVLSRCLISYQLALEQADRDTRGMDGYA